MTEKHNPATAATVKKNAEVYKFLDFNDKQEAEFARRGLIAAWNPSTTSCESIFLCMDFVSFEMKTR